MHFNIERYFHKSVKSITASVITRLICVQSGPFTSLRHCMNNAFLHAILMYFQGFYFFIATAGKQSNGSIGE